MKRILLASSLLALAPVAQADIVFSDNFDANSLGLNVVPTGWAVTAGTVDIIGSGFYDLMPGSGKYIDLDGSSSNPGVLSKSFTLTAGTQYTAYFNLAGNHRTSSSDTVTTIFGVGLGNVSDSFILTTSTGWSSYSLSFTPTATQSYVLSFENSGADNMGALLDNVRIESTVAPVPEPETYAMMLAGLGLLGLARRRHRRLPA